MTGSKPKRARVFLPHPDGWYVEGEDCTDALLQNERFTPLVLDPCCGAGNIPRALARAGYLPIGQDKVNRMPAGQDAPEWFGGVQDFLAPDYALPPDLAARGDAFSVVMNPPYFRGKGTLAFIEKALSLPGCVKVACFVELRFLAGERRASPGGIWYERAPNGVYVLCPRPCCPPGTYLAGGGKAEGGSQDWCWLVWDLLSPPATNPVLGWALRPGATDAEDEF